MTRSPFPMPCGAARPRSARPRRAAPAYVKARTIPVTGRVVDQRRLLAAAALDVHVEGVVAGVEHAAREPAVEGRAASRPARGPSAGPSRCPRPRRPRSPPGPRANDRRGPRGCWPCDSLPGRTWRRFRPVRPPANQMARASDPRSTFSEALEGRASPRLPSSPDRAKATLRVARKQAPGCAWTKQRPTMARARSVMRVPSARQSSPRSQITRSALSRSRSSTPSDSHSL